MSAPATPRGLGARGRRLWAEVVGDGGPELKPPERVLLEEACRTADRLDRLDRVLQDDEDWMRFRSLNEDGAVVKVIMTGALAEVRQQQVALKQLLGELRQSRAAAAKPPKGATATPGASATGEGVGAGGGGLLDLTARIRERSGQASG